MNSKRLYKVASLFENNAFLEGKLVKVESLEKSNENINNYFSGIYPKNGYLPNQNCNHSKAVKQCGNNFNHTKSHEEVGL